MEHSQAMAPLRFALFVLGVMFLSACDGYIEQVTLDDAGAVEFRAEATVVCTDPLQREVWGGDGCEQIDAAVRGGEAGELPFDFQVDMNRLSLVADGDLDRRRLDATWEGTIVELETLLVTDAAISALDDTRTEATFSSVGSAADALAESDDHAIGVAAATWETAQFRVIAPDVVVEHNGDLIQGRTVVWQIDGDQPDEFRLVWSGEERGFPTWWWIVAGGIVAVVLFMIIRLEGPNRTGRPASAGD